MSHEAGQLNNEDVIEKFYFKCSVKTDKLSHDLAINISLLTMYVLNFNEFSLACLVTIIKKLTPLSLQFLKLNHTKFPSLNQKSVHALKVE